MIYDLFCKVRYDCHYGTRQGVEGDMGFTGSEIEETKKVIMQLTLIYYQLSADDRMKDTETAFQAERELGEKFDYLGSLHARKERLFWLLANWDACHDKDGAPIPLPEGMDMNAAFLNVK